MTLADRLLCYFVCIFIQEILSFLVPNPEEQHLLANIFIDEEDTDSMADSWNDLLTQQNKVLFWNDLYEEDRSNREMVESTKTTKRTKNPRGKGPNVPNRKRKGSDKELRDLQLTVGNLKKRLVALEALGPNGARATDVENNDDMNQEEHREANLNDPVSTKKKMLIMVIMSSSRSHSLNLLLFRLKRSQSLRSPRRRQRSHYLHLKW